MAIEIPRGGPSYCAGFEANFRDFPRKWGVLTRGAGNESDLRACWCPISQEEPMSRHPVDHEKDSAETRVKPYAKVIRSNGPEGSHPATQVLMKRDHSRAGASARVANFLRIDHDSEH
jgi:hypothetical protein